MKMKMTNNTMLTVINVLNKFAFVGGKLGYAIYKTKNKLSDELRGMQDMNNMLLQKYGVEKDGEFVIDETNENYDKFIEEFIPILGEETEIEITQVSREDFDKVDIYSEEASMRDYEIIEEMFVKIPENEEKKTPAKKTKREKK